MAIPAVAWKAKDLEIRRVLDRHNLYGEIHTAWILRRYPEQERIPAFERMSPDDRREAVLRALTPVPSPYGRSVTEIPMVDSA